MSLPNNNYSESAMVEKPAIELFKNLGWEFVDCYGEFDSGKSFLGRETKSDVVLVSRLKPAIKKLNPNVSDDFINEAINIIIADRNLMGMAYANKEVYQLIKDGVVVECLNNKNESVSERLKIIDWDNPENNDFLLASQFWVSGDIYTRRADLVGFVNGIPLLFIELKAFSKNIKEAYDNNLRDYKNTIPQIFHYNGIIILSNGSESRVGSISSDWEHFAEWKRINDEGEKGVVSLETIIKAVCDRKRFLDIIENYSIFREEKNGLIKIIAKNHQYLGVEKAIRNFNTVYKNRTNKQLGVFWHTQGSGKTESMIFFSQKILRKIPGNWTFVIVTDRKELDEQTYKRFVRSGIITGAQVWAEDSENLRKLLTENHRFIFTTIQKFRTEKGKIHPVISDRSDIIVIADEAHRTQYDIFAMNMRNALPNAAFMAFTGTPLIAGEEKTKEVFGDYVSIYDFKRAIEDKATVPLYYENRKPHLNIKNLNLNEDIYKIIEEAELTDEEERKFEREFSKEYQLITREDRLEEIAKDIVIHFMNRGFMGKAMVVAIDKATAVKMYDKVKKYWLNYIEKLEKDLKKEQDDKKREEIFQKIKYMKETDMAVVVSQSQNEVEDLKKKGVDILPHRLRMNKEALDEKFKDPDNPLRLVFVCAMWMTGFDVPSCSTIYLDKPMKNHTLMQTIARVNRVFGENKVAGLIVDYIGILYQLNQALSIYITTDKEGISNSPIVEKSELISQLEKYINEIKDLFSKWDIDIEKILNSKELECINLIDNAVENILRNDERKKTFALKNSIIQRTYKAILPDTFVSKYQPVVKLLGTISKKINLISPEVDISDVIKQVSDLLDRSVKVDTRYSKETFEEYVAGSIMDLTKIDINKLKEEFEKGKKIIIAERLKKAIEVKIQALYMLNKSRINFLEKFQELVNEYNAGSVNVEEYYKKLLELVESLNKEEKRSISENLTEEELAIYDLLTKNAPIDLTQKEILKVKKIAKELLEKLKKEKLVIDWRKKQQARASVKLCIEEVLEELPESFNSDLYHQKCELVFQHIYDSYPDKGENIYTIRSF